MNQSGKAKKSQKIFLIIKTMRNSIDFVHLSLTNLEKC